MKNTGTIFRSSHLPNKINEILKKDEEIQQLALLLKDCPNAIYLGRGCQYPVALEGALKLKEISYIHAEGYPAAEMKHGPIALIDEKMPVFVIATRDTYYEKIVQYQRSRIPQGKRNRSDQPWRRNCKRYRPTDD